MQQKEGNFVVLKIIIEALFFYIYQLLVDVSTKNSLRNNSTKYQLDLVIVLLASH